MRLTSWEDEQVIRGLEQCQTAFVADHCLLYEELFPSFTREQWSRALSCGSLKEYLQSGVMILHAIVKATGQVIGYISCSRKSSDHGTGDPDAALGDSSPSRRSPGSNGVSAAEAEACEQPHAKINHFIVLPEHRGKGVGNLLFQALLKQLAQIAPQASDDLRIIAVELNARAIEWYRRLGFVCVELYKATAPAPATKNSRNCPLVYLRMQRAPSTPPWHRFFGGELIGEKVAVLPDSAPPFALERAAAGIQSGRKDGAVVVPPAALVSSFDPESGLHTLQHVGLVNLTAKFARGRMRAEKPLHEVLGRNSQAKPKKRPSPESEPTRRRSARLAATRFEAPAAKPAGRGKRRAPATAQAEPPQGRCAGRGSPLLGPEPGPTLPLASP